MREPHATTAPETVTDTETLTEVSLSPGQYRTLERLTTPHSSQTSHITGLRAALGTVTHRDGHYTVQLTRAQILAADYVLRVGALRGGGEEHDSFHARYVSTVRPDTTATVGTGSTDQEDDTVSADEAVDAVLGEEDDELEIESIAGYLHGTGAATSSSIRPKP
ncbi:hypothetical protein AB0G48_18280 [Streptomyces rubiginosohelvolus]|uniref:hypothetical protein n=1 Tax=Streptomyces rubiginosohelvolus TaxID=67362 RepID=UPI0033D9964F